MDLDDVRWKCGGGSLCRREIRILQGEREMGANARFYILLPCIFCDIVKSVRAGKEEVKGGRVRRGAASAG